jgi:hypothetical protein
MGFWADNTCQKVPLQVNFYLDDDILHCLLCVLSFYSKLPTQLILSSGLKWQKILLTSGNEDVILAGKTDEQKKQDQIIRRLNRLFL